ncbi:unnamed protein product [Arctia plantaginis]|uniref:Uncharacterized protein n=1 Tax=Arctia plantaginis TaxID=874455 RepID=A0A8S0YNP3_ARCPL|nr:unnamed protein product [Arctia plantaginis]
MTSEVEALKTNEFLRRRKLRLQQVREQSKDIAKKIRQRAKVETIRQVVDLDAKKQKEYFDRQEKLVKRLEVLYARGVNNVGASHQSASELTQDAIIKTDLSKLRGREAAAELRKKRQEKLDEQKKLLDRKIQARENANIISREKSAVVANKLTKPTTSKSEDATQKPPEAFEILNASITNVNKDESQTVTRNDMATQWEAERTPNEWEAVVPTLELPKDDQGSSNQDDQVSKSDKSKKVDLFAVSKEMPTDLGGQHVHISNKRNMTRPSLTLVSEYLQTRKLRLREPEPANIHKKSDDISSLKQTILRTRTAKAEGRCYDMCCVCDDQVIPVPSWHAARSCEFCANQTCHNKSLAYSKQFTSVTNSQINKIFSSIRPLKESRVGPSPVLRSTSPFRRNKVSQKFCKGNTCSDNIKPNIVLNKKSSITMYNHNTRDVRDLPCSDELVVRDEHTEEDAYSLAQKESQIHIKNNQHEKKVQDIRNKVAVTKQTVEKEYKDTINFLNSLPKDNGNRVPKTAYMDERRQKMQNENRQHKMQQEYRKIEKECRRHHSCMKKGRKSVSPSKQDVDDDFEVNDFQYSWMPVPEGDGNLAIHTIPNSVKEGKSGNTVKFSKVDSYHEYRSRHKHTPPTKDTAHVEKVPYENNLEPVVNDRTASQSTDDSSTTSDTSSVENLRLYKKENKKRYNTKTDQDASDAERIIIYKILDTRNDKQSKKKNKLLSDIAKSLTSIEKVQKSVIEDNQGESIVRQKRKPVNDKPDDAANFEHIHEGVYKLAEEQKDNMASTFLSNDDQESALTAAENRQDLCKKLSKDKHIGTVPEWESGYVRHTERTPKTCQSSNTCKQNINSTVDTNIASTSAKHPQTCSSVSSFKSASNDQTKSASLNTDYIKVVNEAGLEAGKFFLGSTDLLKNNAYEVVIQLRKKDSSKDEKEPEQSKPSSATESKLHKKSETVESIHLVTSESESNLPQNFEADNVMLNFPGHNSGQTSPINSAQIKDPVTSTQLEVESETFDNYKDQTVLSNTKDTCHKKTFEERKKFSDKGTTTTVQNDSPIQMSKFEPQPRPGTTAYTQTTSSPIHRPVYIHMSSSTSTAYMSPPDMILPNFLRNDSRLTDYETCEIKNVRKSVNSNKTQNNKNCRHARKAVGKDNMKTTYCRKNKHHSTLPNSVSSLYKNADNMSSKNFNQDKCKCHKCSDQVNERCSKSKQSALEGFRLSQNFNLLTSMKGSARTKNLTSRPDKNRGYLNPTVKSYINKLLALNKESLKAIEIADQECSSVATPSSSIINVPYNVDERKPSIGNKISLEHIKQTFMQQIIDEHINNYLNEPKIPPMFAGSSKKHLLRKSRRKVHKVKSLNVSKHLLKKHKFEEPKSTNHVSISTTTDDCNKSFASSNPNRSRPRSSPSSRQEPSLRMFPTFKESNKTELTSKNKIKKTETQRNKKKEETPHLRTQYMTQRSAVTESSQESETIKESHNYCNKTDVSVSMSTQTNQNIDNDFMKLAEDKLHNMEKIADLTEKCTKRLSNLAKVLEEVRKNKSLVYSQISSSDSIDSHSDHKSDKFVKTPVPIDLGEVPKYFEIKSPDPIAEKECIPVSEKEKSLPEFISILTDIPKPAACQISEFNLINPLPTDVIRPIPVTPTTHQHNPNTIISESIKYRQKPPPALSRIHLKHGQEDIVPHELSTVIEVDSPMSIKNKTQSSRRNDPNFSNRSSNEDKEPTKNNKANETSKDKEIVNPDLLESNLKISKPHKLSSAESSDDSKFHMIDLKHFNKIMLQPFISIHEYAKQYNIDAPEEMSNVEELQRDDPVNDDMSSLHSDGSLPDVIAELLKRNIITEPFKFDTGSNVNSTTISSESTLSMLALSKARKAKKRANVVFQNKENIGETSDTLSISSNPDLENAFKKLGMGWASSTLKKTKERLALSSSSNTSSSSISHLKIKSFHHDIPALVTDSVSSVLLSKKDIEAQNLVDNAKDAKHQTSFPNSMTVNEFLANELANKITFTTNKTGINETEEFVSLFETKMPEGMNQQTLMNSDQHSTDSVLSGVNRARTSTPVQIFKSMTYHSSSGSNTSNGLFSNADDLSSVKMTSNSVKNHSASDRDDLTIPNFSLKMKKGIDSSKSD